MLQNPCLYNKLCYVYINKDEGVVSSIDVGGVGVASIQSDDVVELVSYSFTGI